MTLANFSDLAFVLDCTGSMQRYINATRDHVIGICDMIRGEQGLNGPDDLRVAVCLLRSQELIVGGELQRSSATGQYLCYQDQSVLIGYSKGPGISSGING